VSEQWREICGFLVHGLECLLPPGHTEDHSINAFYIAGIKHENGKVYLRSGGRP
jgi:hypothetical protein